MSGTCIFCQRPIYTCDRDHLIYMSVGSLSQRPRQRPLVSPLLSLSLCVRDQYRGHLCQRPTYCVRDLHTLVSETTGIRVLQRSTYTCDSLADRGHLYQRPTCCVRGQHMFTKYTHLCQRPTYCDRVHLHSDDLNDNTMFWKSVLSVR